MHERCLVFLVNTDYERIHKMIYRVLSRNFYLGGEAQLGGRGGGKGEASSPNLQASPPNVACCGDLEKKLSYLCTL